MKRKIRRLLDLNKPRLAQGNAYVIIAARGSDPRGYGESQAVWQQKRPASRNITQCGGMGILPLMACQFMKWQKRFSENLLKLTTTILISTWYMY